MHEGFVSRIVVRLETEAFFLSHDGLGPRRVAEFMGGASDDDIQADVVGFVRDLCRKLGT